MSTAPFQRAYVINLLRRPDRLKAFWERLDAADWPADWPRPLAYQAIEGDVVGVPQEFTQGGGAYGCRMSHLRILQDCLMTGVEPVLVLEDDADMRPGFGLEVQHFLAKVPGDWEGIMLGGQHHANPQKVSDGVVRVQYAQRTHAYVARGRYLKGLQQRWGNTTVHIDWVMRDWQHEYKIYAPERWLVGQAGGRSDIRGAEKPVEWWNTPREDEPVILLRCPRPVMEELRRRGFHTGMDRNEQTGIDKGLPSCFDPRLSAEDREQRMRRWIRKIQEECGEGKLLCTVWHPDATRESVAAACNILWEINAETVDEAMSQLPTERLSILRQSSLGWKKPVLLLRCPRAAMEELRNLGFHTGYWRNGDGVDHGLVRIFGSLQEADRLDALKKWLAELGREADRDGKILTVWHPQATTEMIVAAGAERVVEITAHTSKEALGQFHNMPFAE